MSIRLSKAAETAMEAALTDQRDQLRSATEEDVERALAGSYVEDVLQGIAPDVLLEFWERMLDQRIGREPET